MLLLLALALSSHFVSADDSGWIPADDSDGIKVWKKEMPDTGIIAFKGSGLIDAPVAKVASVLTDMSLAKDWVDDLVESRLVREISPMEYVEYDHIGTPFIIKDRDFVLDTRFKIDPKAKTFSMISRSVVDPLAPETNHVRGEIRDSFVLASAPGGKTFLTGEIYADPKGSIPKWIVNFFQKGWPHDTLQALRKEAAKPGIKINPLYQDLR